MTVNIVLLKNFNNYFNRLVRYKETLSEYAEISDSFIIPSVNFNPNDGVTATHIVGSEKNKFEEEWNPDYCLIIDPTTSEIISRWFVIEFRRTMINQYEMTLKRDSIADNLTLVKNAPFYCEKGYLKETDSFIVNNEGMSFNQIKANEYFLKDKTKIPWVVVYLNQKKSDGTSRDDWDNIESSYFSSDMSDLPHIEDNPTMKELFLDSSGKLSLNAERKKMTDVITNFNFSDSSAAIYSAYIEDNGTSSRNCGYRSKVATLNTLIDKPQYFLTPQFERKLDEIGVLMNNNNYYGKLKNVSPFNQFNYSVKESYPLPQTAKLWYYQNHVYSLSIKVEDVESVSSDVNNTDLNSDIYNFVEMILKADFSTMHNNPPFFNVSTQGKKITYTLTENISNKIYGSIKKDNNHCLDVPYDVIAMPLGAIEIKNHGTLPNAVSELVAGLNFARTLVVGGKTGDIVFGGSNIYDVQVLPYCPLEGDNIVSEGFIDLSKGTEHGNYEIITDKKSTDNPTKIISVMLFASYASNSFDIETVGDDILSENEINVSDILKITDRKIQNECEFYRLVSPNCQGMFDFNVAKSIWPSETNISKFNVDIVCRPFNPYIHINPDFGFLYGKDYNDSRGLICGGDFSITMVNSAWTSYELNNKNFQNMFDRQIAHMETERGFARERESLGLLNAEIGAGFATGAGIIGGAKKFGIGGALLGGTLGTIGGAMKIGNTILNSQINEEQYKENVKYSIDMFNMQLDNIKAIPQSLTKSSSLSYNYKFFPTLEFYTCTTNEKQALKSKIKYNGMTVGRIGSISEFLNSEDETFIKGQMIRLDSLSDDSHIANDIYNEVNNGLFFEKEEE